ncbi:hypothetical protein HBI56_076820 [Parastagonospora nodorum]|nr:hypothetical protein HBH52_062150 [Parastagonospora nodorum]KAH4054129.1 hypothetical protein HBH49_076200 [Parastagonospora nodorum]KAH4210652.1 hypothetical protein HBI95_062380 [Parastagonospora nodorum]KAH4225799.1 hypothetical protein HBI06_114750 [Parastagonospora nodorum]KAH4247168.1 hypothetical protein HBI05_041700 [Parastagonospora nodorum]
MAFSFKHAITGAKSSEIIDAPGGIIADDMGLGKTLSMLAAVVASVSQAVQDAFSSTRAPTSYWRDIIPSKCTLVVVPSALLMDSWLDEVEKHFVHGTLLLHRYHGKGKTIDISLLLQHDVVLTTYASITAEFCRGSSRLHRIQWYRLVLDEAHFIRNPTTKQFRAINALPSKIRWCMTGTPIQNSLEDLGALVKFLKVPVLDDLALFRKQITTPVVSNVSGRFTNLRRLLEAICLRRTKALLNLPEPVTETELLELSAPESTMYRDFGDLCKRAINLAVSGHSVRKANQHVIQAILGMRLFCNDGEYALTKRMNTLGLPSDPDEALSYLQTLGRSTCVQCGTDITTMYANDDASSGHLTIRQHLICGECLPAYEEELDESQEEGRTRCPVCETPGNREAFVLRPKPDVQDRGVAMTKKPSTKLLALMKNVQRQSVDDKCIVFSFWKTTLDIAAHMFDTASLRYSRIHGQIPASKRSKILSSFESSNDVRILLITLGTGAVGLNKLKVANHIHILEPQWNPSVESQAIGRILRMGQEKSVRITRYIMKGTVEKAVQSRQLRKLQLASGGFGFVKDEHNSNRVQEIMNLLCPTRSKLPVADTDRQALVSSSKAEEKQN